MADYRVLKIYSNKQSEKYKSFMKSIIKSKPTFKKLNIKIKMMSSNHDLIGELLNRKKEIIYRTRNPNVKDIFKKCGLKISSIKIDSYSNHKHSGRLQHKQIENEIIDSISQKPEKMSIYIKGTSKFNTVKMNQSGKGINENGKISVFIKPTINDDEYKYDENGNFIRGLKGIGYKDANKAKQTIDITESLLNAGQISQAKQMGIIMKMYYRAKNHKYQTDKMKSAIRVYKDWLKKNEPE